MKENPPFQDEGPFAQKFHILTEDKKKHEIEPFNII